MAQCFANARTGTRTTTIRRGRSAVPRPSSSRPASQPAPTSSAPSTAPSPPPLSPASTNARRPFGSRSGQRTPLSSPKPRSGGGPTRTRRPVARVPLDDSRESAARIRWTPTRGAPTDVSRWSRPTDRYFVDLFLSCARKLLPSPSPSSSSLPPSRSELARPASFSFTS